MPTEDQAGLLPAGTVLKAASQRRETAGEERVPRGENAVDVKKMRRQGIGRSQDDCRTELRTEPAQARVSKRGRNCFK